MSLAPASSRILIVEDAPANIQALSAVLREQGYLLHVAPSGRQALEVLATIRPDLILLDVMMPGMDGFETCARINAEPAWRDSPIIFLAAKTDTGDIVSRLAHGAVAHVSKAIPPRHIEAIVDPEHDMDRVRKEIELRARVGTRAG